MSEPDNDSPNTASPAEIYRRFRRNTRNRRLVIALAVSAAVHLSAVTIFKIVLYFEVPEIRFYEFRFVQPPRVNEASSPEDRELAARWERLPRIDAPLLRDTGGQLTLARRDLNSAGALEGLFGDAEPALGEPRLGNTFQPPELGMEQLSLGGDGGLNLGPDIEGNSQRFVPVAGFAATLTWPQREAARPLLFSPPLRSLWSMDAGILAQGLALELSVDAGGKVTRVWSSVPLPAESLDALVQQIMQYRFEPEASDSILDETVLLLLRAEGDAP
ncbi:MAG: hypothetical protein RLZZ303_2836 [Candidatus Hydrogenedentota bacterium]|jgi:hypothetical protein